MADFKVTADSEVITIEGLTIAPAEAESLRSAISFAGAMQEIPNLPPQIDYEQFVVQFFEDGSLIVSRSNGPGGSIKFSFNTVDQLVVTITSALGISVDAKRLRPSPRAVGDPGFLSEGEID